MRAPRRQEADFAGHHEDHLEAGPGLEMASSVMANLLLPAPVLTLPAQATPVPHAWVMMTIVTTGFGPALVARRGGSTGRRSEIDPGTEERTLRSSARDRKAISDAASYNP